MPLAPASRSRLHEVVLAACVLGCLANALRPRDARPPALAEPAAEATTGAVEIAVDPEDARPAAR